MKLTQLSLFLENKPSHLKVPCRILAEAGVNIITLSLADTQQFGILRIIVRDWARAKKALEEGGCVVKCTDVVAVEVPDKPGGLADLLEAIQNCALNIEYMYAFTERRGDRAVMVFRFEDPDAAVDALGKVGVNVVGGVDLFDAE
jgi:hypothetical protein